MSTAVSKPDDLAFEARDLVKRTVAKGASDDELQMFLYQAKRTGLDPLSGQIHFVKRWDAMAGREVGKIQIGIDGFRLIAARTGKYRPDDTAPRYTLHEKTGALISVRVRVFILHGTAWHPVEVEAFYDEYVQRKKDGNPTAMWSRMPKMMLAKCAESLALRKAFPAELSGVYSTEEMGGEPTIDSDTGEIQDPPAVAGPTPQGRPEPPSPPEGPAPAGTGSPELASTAAPAPPVGDGSMFNRADAQNEFAIARGLAKLGWTDAMRKLHLKNHYGVETVDKLNEKQLEEFADELEGLVTTLASRQKAK